MNEPGSNMNFLQVLDMDPYDQIIGHILKSWAAHTRPPHAVRTRLLMQAAAQDDFYLGNPHNTYQHLQTKLRRSVGSFENNPALHSFHLGMGVLSLMR